MPSLDDIIDRVRDRAGADFAFILSRRGRLVTRHAPENMPEEGRGDLVMAAEHVMSTNRVALRTMPREALVPYGGAAPIDVYVAAREAAVVCVVMATWTDQSTVAAAFDSGLTELDELIDGALAKRQKPESKRRRKTDSPDAPLSAGVSSVPPSASGRKTNAPRAPASERGARGTTLEQASQQATALRGKTKRPPPFGLAVTPRAKTPRPTSVPPPGSVPPPLPAAKRTGPPPLPNGAAAARAPKPAPSSRKGNAPTRAQLQAKLEPPSNRGTLPFLSADGKDVGPLALPPRMPSGPEITVGRATIGRATLAAIELESAAPQITFGVAPLGRETLSAIDASVVPEGKKSGSAPDLRVELVSMPDIDPRELDIVDRSTLPFTEAPADAKRAFEESARQRKVQAPDVRVKLSDLDWDTRAAVLEENHKRELEEKARAARKQVEAQAKRNSNLDAWHDALSELVVEEPKAQTNKKRPRAR